MSVYKDCSRDDVEDCRLCGSPLAGDNDTGICYKCATSKQLLKNTPRRAYDPAGHRFNGIVPFIGKAGQGGESWPWGEAGD